MFLRDSIFCTKTDGAQFSSCPFSYPGADCWWWFLSLLICQKHDWAKSIQTGLIIYLYMISFTKDIIYPSVTRLV